MNTYARPFICVDCRMHLAGRCGVCDWCFRRARRAVRAGKTTWAELERRGRILPTEWSYGPGEVPEKKAGLVDRLVIFAFALVLPVVGLIAWAVGAGKPFGVVGMMMFVFGCVVMLSIVAAVLEQDRG